MKHLMLDCETLGTATHAAIISLGAVRFDLNSTRIDDAGFYASISLQSNLELGRIVQEDTLLWWLRQTPAAQAVFAEPKCRLEEALVNLTEWIGGDDLFVWSNGADFDVPMIADAYRSLGMAIPWKFWNTRCVRTYKNLPQAKGISTPRAGVKHNALTDALNQARLVQTIHAVLSGPSTGATA